MIQKNRLRELRKKKGIRLAEVARAADVSESYIGHIERGVRMPSWRIALRIARFMDVGVLEVFFVEEEGPETGELAIRD